MLRIHVPATEHFNEQTMEFIDVSATTLVLEHSLVSLAKWESKWNLPFLTDDNKTPEQTLDYIRCMTITQNVNPLVYSSLTGENIREVLAYIKAPMTATVFPEASSGGRRNTEIMTAEVLYYYMTAFNIPFECQKWHLSRLLTLIRVCNVKNAPTKKLSRQEIFERNRELNAKRKAELNTKG